MSDMSNITTTDLKCKGQKCEVPEKPNELENEKPKYFCQCIGQKLHEWICASCWKAGVRFTNENSGNV